MKEFRLGNFDLQRLQVEKVKNKLKKLGKKDDKGPQSKNEFLLVVAANRKIEKQ